MPWLRLDVLSWSENGREQADTADKAQMHGAHGLPSAARRTQMSVRSWTVQYREYGRTRRGHEAVSVTRRNARLCSTGAYQTRHQTEDTQVGSQSRKGGWSRVE